MKLTKLSRYILVVALIFVMVAIPIDKVRAETEPNDTPGQANPLSVGVTGDTNASLSSSSDVDWYKVTVTQDRWYVFETYNVSTNLHTLLRLYATDGTTQLAYDYSSGTGNTLSRITWQAPSSGDYYLRVSSSSGAGPYSIRALAKYDEGATWDGTYEPNDTWQIAHLINVGRDSAINTTIYPRGPYSTNTGDYDFFRFNAILGNWYVIETYNVATTLNTFLSVYDIDGGNQLAYDYGSGTGNSEARIIWQAPQTGIFYICVRAESSTQEGAYSLRVLPKYDESGSWDTNGEPDDEWVSSYPLTLNQALSRSLYQRGNYTTNNPDYDLFWFAAQAGYQYTVNLYSVASTLSANLYIIGLDGSTVLASNTNYTNPGTPKSLTHTFYTTGIYYVKVRPYSSSYDNYGNYQLQVSTSGNSSLFVSKQELRFVAIQSGSSPSSASLIIANTGSGIFNWSASANQTWLNLSAMGGSAGSPTALQVTANTGSLSAGDYTAQITITADNAVNTHQVVQVSLRVDPALTPTSEAEPNDTVGTASILSVGWLTPALARISSSSDVDWYRFTAISGYRYVFETYNVSPHLGTLLRLYNTDGSTQITYDYSSGTGNALSRIIWQATSSNDYYLRVSGSSGAGPYSIRILARYNEGGTWDGFHEPNDNWETAHSIGVGRENAIFTTVYPRGAYSTNTGDYDWFRFSAVLGHRYVIETYNVAPSLNTFLALFDTNGTSQIDYDYGSGTGNSEARIVWQAPQTGDFFIRVRAESSSESGGYSVRVLPKYDEGASWDTNWEPDDEWVTATPIILNQTQSRNIYERGNYRTNNADYDYFWFYAQAGYQYTVNLQSIASTLSANLYILSLDGTTVLASNTNYTPPGTPKSLSYTFATPGNYYVRVRPYSNSYDDYGDYQIRVISIVPAVQVNLENVSLTGALGNDSTSHQILSIANSGFGSFDWTLESSQQWLHIDKSSGTAPPTTNVEVWADLTGLSVGTYTAQLTISASGVDNTPFVIPVTLTIKENLETYIYLPIIIR
ncbi:MAG: pre-peptidase C-terminal domain-containing protein [Caldilineaceae bacterium]|nr:pre-peptidase C-terminal domain-containing protein [Caldilineaceae bacterium]